MDSVNRGRLEAFEGTNCSLVTLAGLMHFSITGQQVGIMKRIWQFLSDLWRRSERKPWQFLQNLFYIVDKDPPACGRSGNEADNKILDEWMEEYKGRITPEAREEYRRRVFRAATEKK